MKKLSSVTYKEAMTIVKAGYPEIFYTQTRSWILTDESKDIGEPCKKLKSKNKVVLFWFFDDKIDVDVEPDGDNPIDFLDRFKDASIHCYVKALELGFDIPAFESLPQIKTLEEVLKVVYECDEYLSEEQYEKGKPVQLNYIGAGSILHKKLKQFTSVHGRALQSVPNAETTNT